MEREESRSIIIYSSSFSSSSSSSTTRKNYSPFSAFLPGSSPVTPISTLYSNSKDYHEKSSCSSIKTAGSEEMILQYLGLKKGIMSSLVLCVTYSFRWDACGDLHMWQNRSAFLCHPETREKIWFNHIHIHHHSYHKAFPTFIEADVPNEKCPGHTYYGDGIEIEPEVIQHIRATAWECTVGFQWRSGDLLVLDNLAVLHGRIGFTGDRKIVVYFHA